MSCPKIKTYSSYLKSLQLPLWNTQLIAVLYYNVQAADEHQSGEFNSDVVMEV